LRLSGLRLSVYRGGDKTVPCFKLE
jgi:hypothetical protein